MSFIFGAINPLTIITINVYNIFLVTLSKAVIYIFLFYYINIFLINFIYSLVTKNNSLMRYRYGSLQDQDSSINYEEKVVWILVFKEIEQDLIATCCSSLYSIAYLSFNSYFLFFQIVNWITDVFK